MPSTPKHFLQITFYSTEPLALIQVESLDDHDGPSWAIVKSCVDRSCTSLSNKRALLQNNGKCHHNPVIRSQRPHTKVVSPRSRIQTTFILFFMPIPYPVVCHNGECLPSLTAKCSDSSLFHETEITDTERQNPARGVHSPLLPLIFRIMSRSKLDLEGGR